MLYRFVQWLVDDERLKPREDREIHPIDVDHPDLLVLTNQVARLWDQVWWLSLPWYMRLIYKYMGFTAPQGRFYLKLGEHWK